jgi:hypothetical protein
MPALRPVGLVRNDREYELCIAQAFLPARHQVLSLCVRPWVRWTASRASAPAGDRNKYVFRKSQSSAAAIGTGAASYMAPTVTPGQSRLQLLDAVGRLTHSRWPGTHPLVKEGRSTSLSPEPEPDAFLSVFRRTSMNIPAFRKARINPLEFL